MSLYQTICAVEEIHKSSQLFKCANSTSRKSCTKNKQTLQTRAAISLVVGLCNLCRLLHDGGTKMPNSRLLLYSAFLTLLRRDLCSSRSPAHKRWNPNLALDGVASPRSYKMLLLCEKPTLLISSSNTGQPGRQLIQTWRPPKLTKIKIKNKNLKFNI